MNEELEKLSEIPCICTQNHLIHKVSNSFLQLTGYEECDLIGKSLSDIEELLKLEDQLSIQDITDTQRAYIFTRANVPIEVEISTTNESSYHFTERIDPTLAFILTNFANDPIYEEESEAVFSYPACILLKHDEQYLRTLTALGATAAQPVGKHPSLPVDILELFERGTSFHERDIESKSSAGVATYWDIRVKMLRGEGEANYFVASFRQKPHHVTTRAMTKKEKSEIERIVDHMSDVVNIVDKHGNYTYMNKAGKEFLAPYVPKYIPDLQSVTNRMTYDAFTVSDQQANTIAFKDTIEQRVLRGETLRDHMTIGTSELSTTYYVCDGTPIYDEQGNIDGGIFIYRNVEDDYKTEQYKALQENEEEIPIYYATFYLEDFKVTHLNKAAFKAVKEEKSYVKSELDIIGNNFFDFFEFQNEEELIEDIHRSVENKTSFIHQNNFMHKGKKIYTKAIFQPVFTASGELDKIIILGLDISEEIRMTKEMKRQLTNQEELFINTSHELNTPLSVIFSGAQLMDLYLKQDSLEEVRDEISSINATTIGNCYRLMKLVNNILDISKLESGLYELNLRNYNMVKVIDDIVESVSEFTKLKDIDILFDTEVEELIIALDGYKFDRILLNLISNAIKFSVTGEVIWIKLVEKDEHTVSISVTDHGIGIDPRNAEEIFQKYIQVNRDLNRLSEGTGLGLPLARSMAELHGGSLHVESALGEGSEFIVELPIRQVEGVQDIADSSHSADRDEIIKYEFSDIYLP